MEWFNFGVKKNINHIQDEQNKIFQNIIFFLECLFKKYKKFILKYFVHIGVKNPFWFFTNQINE